MSEMDKSQEPFRGSKDQRSSQEGSLAGISTGQKSKPKITEDNAIAVINAALHEIDAIIYQAEWGISNEVIGGNVVKENFWRGQKHSAESVKFAILNAAAMNESCQAT